MKQIFSHQEKAKISEVSVAIPTLLKNIPAPKNNSWHDARFLWPLYLSSIAWRVVARQNNESLKIEGRHSIGEVDYKAVNNAGLKNVDDWSAELRGIFGKEYAGGHLQQ